MQGTHRPDAMGRGL